MLYFKEKSVYKVDDVGKIALKTQNISVKR